MSNLIAPLPPLAEQRRIVARVDQLMSLCDELEAGLLRSQADSERMMEAVVGGCWRVTIVSRDKIITMINNELVRTKTNSGSLSSFRVRCVR